MLQWFQDAILEVMTRMERHRRNYRSAVVSGLSNAKNKRQNEMKLEERWDLIDAADCRSFWNLWNNQSSSGTGDRKLEKNTGEIETKTKATD